MTLPSGSLIAALVVVVALAGCGETSDESGGPHGSDTTTTTTTTPECPTSADIPLVVPAGWPQTTWSACGNNDGTEMALFNLTDESLLVEPHGLAFVSVLPSAAAFGTPEELAQAALAQALDPARDPQATDVRPGSKYLGPHRSVRITSLLPNGATVSVRKDYYATARWAVSTSVASWAVGKVTPRPLALRNAVLGCAQDVSVSGADVANPPALSDIIHNTVGLGIDCSGLLRSLTSEEKSAATLADEVADLSKGIVKEVPAGFWEDLLHAAGQLLRHA